MSRFLCVIFLVVSNLVFAQNFYLELQTNHPNQKQILDSLGYQKQFTTPKAIVDFTKQFSERLTKIGYLQHRISSLQKTNDSTFVSQLQLGKRTSTLRIITTHTPFLKEMNFVKQDTISVSITDTEAFLNALLQQLEQSGFAISKLKLENFRLEDNLLTAHLKEEISAKRSLDDIVVMGYTKFHEGHKKQLKRMYRKRTLNQQTLKELYQDVQKFSFVNQIKPPEILFTKDSTRVFIYLEKARANSFDGYIGFNTDKDDKVQFTGYLDLLLNNALNSGERLKLYWKNDGNQQQTFDFSAELPYVFNTPFALRGNLNIYKQDSTFQTTKTNFDLGYYLKYNQRIYLGYESVNSNDIQSVSSMSLNDFKSSFFTSTFEYFDLNREDFLFPEKRKFILKGGVGNRKTSFGDTSQYFAHLNGFNNFYLNEKNIIHLKMDGYYLQSDSYVINELHRFGGINSIRGFQENSLQASFLSGLMLEYRYVLAPSIYVHTITDYAYFQDKASDINKKLLGLGFGLGFITNNGLFNFVYANGSAGNQEIKFSNSIVHISFKTNF